MLNEAYICGFIKEAQAYGVTQDEAIQLLKQSSNYFTDTITNLADLEKKNQLPPAIIPNLKNTVTNLDPKITPISVSLGKIPLLNKEINYNVTNKAKEMLPALLDKPNFFQNAAQELQTPSSTTSKLFNSLSLPQNSASSNVLYNAIAPILAKKGEEIGPASMLSMVKGNKYAIMLGLLGHYMEKRKGRKKLEQRSNVLKSKFKTTAEEKEELRILTQELNKQ